MRQATAARNWDIHPLKSKFFCKILVKYCKILKIMYFIEIIAGIS